MATYTKLSLGSRGDEVRRLQTRLNEQGANLAVDGVFGNQTLSAVKNYQTKNGLYADGVVGDLTWGSLLGGGAAAPAAAATASVTYRRSGVSDETAKALARYQKGYTPGAAVTAAEETLRRLEGQRPGDYQSPYGDRLDALLGEIRGRKPFRYDLNSDALYRQYRDQYTALGRQAMDDTLGRAAALTGGYGSSYGQSVGQQTYDGYLQQLNSKVPELYRLALERYEAEGDKLAAEYDALSGREREAYDRWRAALGDWESGVADARRAWADARDFDYGAWADGWKYWQGRADDEYAQWKQETAWARQDDRASGSGRSGSGTRTASGSGRSASAASGGVRIPGYGTVSMAQARAMLEAGLIELVRRDDRKSTYTDGQGNVLARMLGAPGRSRVQMVM